MLLVGGNHDGVSISKKNSAPVSTMRALSDAGSSAFELNPDIASRNLVHGSEDLPCLRFGRRI